jgi:hypothetical protein
MAHGLCECFAKICLQFEVRAERQLACAGRQLEDWRCRGVVAALKKWDLRV